jgi:hypothetical protein
MSKVLAAARRIAPADGRRGIVALQQKRRRAAAAAQPAAAGMCCQCGDKELLSALVGRDVFGDGRPVHDLSSEGQKG